MKLKNGIPQEAYYELLEWKDSNLDDFMILYPGKRLCDLTVLQLHKLYSRIRELKN